MNTCSINYGKVLESFLYNIYCTREFKRHTNLNNHFTENRVLINKSTNKFFFYRILQTKGINQLSSGTDTSVDVYEQSIYDWTICYIMSYPSVSAMKCQCNEKYKN